MSTRVLIEADDDGHVRRYEVLYPGDADVWETAEFFRLGLLAIGFTPEVIAKVLRDEEGGTQ